MTGTSDLIHLEQVIRSYPHGEQLAKELFQDVSIIVDPSQQDGLIAQRDPGISKGSASFPGLQGDLCRVIEMSMDVKR